MRRRTLRETLSRTCGVRKSPALSQTCATNNPDLNRMDYAIWRPCKSESTMAGSLAPLISWSSWGGAHYHGTSLITVSDNGNVVCSELWIRMADTLNTRFTNCLYLKIIVVTDVVLKYFLEYGLQNDFLCKLSAWIRRVDTRGALWCLTLSLR